MKKFPLLLPFIFFCSPLAADVSLPGIFSDNMVLQQNSTVEIWGWAKPGEETKLVASWNGDTLSTVPDNQSHWEIALKTPQAGGPFTITIQGNNRIVLKNVLIGEVWLCSGQSNMEWSATSGIDNAQQEVAAANYPNIRFFRVDHRTALDPQIDLKSSSGWSACTPETMQNFSAVAYFFARRIYQQTGIPIGLINSSWGGTPAEAWTPESIYQNNQKLANSAARLDEVPWGPIEPGRLYNAMIAPITRFDIAGAIWYQGESNTRNADTYRETFTALINSWRSQWGYEFPFYFVQIAPFSYGETRNGVRGRDEQRRTLKLKNTGMAVICDVGDTTDIHPQNKQDVGLRLANLALKHHYQVLDQLADPPLFSGFTTSNNKVTVSFMNAAGLHAKSKRSVLFELAGPDGIYYPARATIKGETVLLQSKEVKQPVQVRYAWGNTTAADLFNQANLPMSSFSSEFE